MPFDPYTLPDEPVVAIEIAFDRDGAEYATVDGTRVEQGSEESARAAAVRAVAALVDGLPPFGPLGRPPAGVRARINGPGFRDYDIAVDRDGRLYVPIGSPQDLALRSAAIQRSSGQGSPGQEVWRAGSRVGAAPAGGVSTAVEDHRTTSETDASGITMRRPDAGAPTPGATGSVGRNGAQTRTCGIDSDTDGADPGSAQRDGWSQTFLDEGARRAGQTPSTGLITPLPAPLRSQRLAGLIRSARDLRPHVAAPRRRELRDPGGTRRLRVRPAVAAVVIAAIIVLAGLGAIAWSLLHPRDGRPGASAGTQTGRAFPGTVPPGWSETPRWVSRPLEAGGGRVLSVGDAVAYVDSDHQLEVVDATTGTNRWRVPLPSGTLRDGLAHTTIGGVPVVAAQVDDTLAWWRVADGRGAGSLELPAGARTTYLGAAPLVGVDEHTVAVVDAGALQRIRVPSGAFALAADPTGRVTAAAGAGWWHLRPGVAAGAVTPWERAAPDDEAPQATPSVVGYLGDSVLVLYPRDRQGRLHMVVHTDARALRVSFRGQVAAVETVSQPWWPSPSGTWGVLGRTLVDLKAGSVTDLGTWTTTWITTDRAYGTLDGRSVQAGPGVQRTEIGADVTIPEVVTAAGAAVRATDGGGERLYLLPPSS